MLKLKITLFFLFLLAFQLSVFGQKSNHDVNLKLWDKAPALDWMTEAYPIGNGKIGGMIFGGTQKEHIQFNESSLWTGDEKETGAYQAFGDIFIEFLNINPSSVINYKRELNLNNAIHAINYQANGTKFSREYFASHPDKVMVFSYASGKKGAYSAIISLKDAHGTKVKAEGNQLKFSGTLANGQQYSAAILIKHNGGSLKIKQAEDGTHQIQLTATNNFIIKLAAATDYVNKRASNWKGSDPNIIVQHNLNAAGLQSLAQLKDKHVKDYQQLFGRTALKLGAEALDTTLTTKERIIDYKKTKNPNLEALLFQYGRYLLISSSRKGGLPANLQGLWNNSNNPPWRSDYHSNINIQMNYWPAEPTNLSECHIPYLDYINSMREVKKVNTQKEYPGVRGWTVRTENNIFGGESFSWNTPGSAWYAQAIWEHYAFTLDKNYLKTFAYPILKEISEFWDDHLKRRADGTVVAPLGWSPEHGPTEDGVSYDQQIVYDLFTNYVEAADSLNIDKTYRDHILALRNNLLKPKIGKWGQLQEWETDRDDPENKHRHASHLFGLHPGRQFSVTQTPELAQAAKVSLTARGDESTGWSMAWKMNFWARLHDGEHAYKILNNFITLVGGEGIDYNNGGGIYSNLLCAHPPFQIDGNLGYTAGVAEMLLQSQTDEIQLLPALPKAWAKGSVKGLKARGNFEINFLEWKNGEVTRLVIKSLSGGKCKLLLPNALKGAFESKQKGNKYSITFNSVAGKSYEFKK